MHWIEMWLSKGGNEGWKRMQPSREVTVYEAWGSALDVADVIVTSPEGLNLGRCRPNFLSTPANVEAARR